MLKKENVLRRLHRMSFHASNMICAGEATLPRKGRAADLLALSSPSLAGLAEALSEAPCVAAQRARETVKSNVSTKRVSCGTVHVPAAVVHVPLPFLVRYSQQCGCAAMAVALSLHAQVSQLELLLGIWSCFGIVRIKSECHDPWISTNSGRWIRTSIICRLPDPAARVRGDASDGSNIYKRSHRLQARGI
eukprot:s3893_g1.t1